MKQAGYIIIKGYSEDIYVSKDNINQYPYIKEHSTHIYKAEVTGDLRNGQIH
jgi:hypothetical protein